MADIEKLQLTEQQKNIFNTFGYMHFPGLFKDDIEQYTQYFMSITTENSWKGSVSLWSLLFSDYFGGLQWIGSGKSSQEVDLAVVSHLTFWNHQQSPVAGPSQPSADHSETSFLL